MPAPPTLDVYVVPHTHWDREWYHPAGRFRQRLVALVDEILGDLPAAPGSFLLDGQAAILEDYLAVRPGRRAALAAALAAGLLEAGPWYVLADELIPSGEALIRNLLAGRRTLAELGGAPPPVLYSPDAFGHAAALPALAAGFGCAMAIVWRGYGGARWPSGDAAWWRAPGGERVLLYHLPPDGYEFGSSLPAEPDAAAERWRRMRAVLEPRARLGVVLVPNGADHHAPQRDFDGALDALARAAAPDRVTHRSLRDFAEAATARAAMTSLPEIAGELRDSYGYTWTLQGTFATRAVQKRRNAQVQRLLERDAEPWLALRTLSGDASDGANDLLHAAWRALLLAHPHDTLCGCSTDEVARAADARFDDAQSQGEGLRDDAIHALLGHDADEARERRPAWQPCLVVRNRAPRVRGGVAEAEVMTFVRDVPVGPGSAGTWAPITPLGATPHVGSSLGSLAVQVLGRSLRHDRIEAPRHYPDDDVVEAADTVVWVPPQDGYSLRSYPLAASAPVPGDDGPRHPVRATDAALDNGLLAIAVDGRGNVMLRNPSLGVVIPALVGFEDVGDVGDLYTHSALGTPITTARHLGVRTLHHGPLRGTLEIRYRVRVAAAAHVDEARDPLSRPTRRTGRHVDLPITLHVSLDADAPFVRVRVLGTNSARDHRFRIVFRTGVDAPDVIADAALGPVARAVLDVPTEDRVAERPPPTAPLHRWVSLSNARHATTLFSDGLAEYEAMPNGDLAVTLLRAVRELSRPDLPERPGHAGWPVPTPEAQSLGPFDGSFALALHDAHSPESLAHVERLADDVLLPLRGETLRAARGLPAPSGGLTLDGDGLAFGAAKPSEDGHWVALRCVNLTDRQVGGAWRVRAPLREAVLSRLDESPGAPLGITEGDAGERVVPIVVGPRGVRTILVR